VGIGGLAVAGVGAGGYFQAGALSNLGQVNAIIMMAAVGGGGLILLIVGIVSSVKNCQTTHESPFHPVVKGGSDPFPTLPVDLVTKEIFSRLGMEGLGRCAQISTHYRDQIFGVELPQQEPVSESWGDWILRIVTNTPLPLVMRNPGILVEKHLLESSFGKEKWETYFGLSVEKPFLPDNILEILQMPCPFWPGKRVWQTHMLVLIPATVNEEPLTLNKLQELIRNPKEGHATDYRYYAPAVQQEYGDTPIEHSYWVLMTRDVLPGSKGKYTKQEGLVSEQEGYSLPKAIEVAVCISVEHFISGTQLFGRGPLTFITRCREQDQNRQPIVVGSFGSDGLNVYYDCLDYDIYGVAALRKFY